MRVTTAGQVASEAEQEEDARSMDIGKERKRLGKEDER